MSRYVVVVLVASLGALSACRKTGGPVDAGPDAGPTLSDAGATPRDGEWTSAGGVGARTDAVDWFAHRGVAKPALAQWFRAHFKTCRPELADAQLATPHFSVRVGSPSEDALYGERVDSCDPLQTSGYVVVVRSGSPGLVLEVPLAVSSYDEPVGWVDLSLSFAADGLSATSSDRAPEGTLLVEPAAWVARRAARAERCEAKLAAGAPVRTEWSDDDAGEPWCPIVIGPDGKRRVDREAYVESDRQRGHYPRTLHDCATALANARQGAAKGAPRERAASGAILAAIERACSKRGRWRWTGDRFVQEAPPGR